MFEIFSSKPRGRKYIDLDLARHHDKPKAGFIRAARSPVVWAGITSVSLTTLYFGASAVEATAPHATSIIVDAAKRLGDILGLMSAFAFTARAYTDHKSLDFCLDTSGYQGDIQKTQRMAYYYELNALTKSKKMAETIIITMPAALIKFAAVLLQVTRTHSHEFDKYILPVIQNIDTAISGSAGHYLAYTLPCLATLSAVEIYAANKLKTHQWYVSDPPPKSRKEENEQPLPAAKLQGSLIERAQLLHPRP